MVSDRCGNAVMMWWSSSTCFSTSVQSASAQNVKPEQQCDGHRRWAQGASKQLQPETSCDVCIQAAGSACQALMTEAMLHA